MHCIANRQALPGVLPASFIGLFHWILFKKGAHYHLALSTLCEPEKESRDKFEFTHKFKNNCFGFQYCSRFNILVAVASIQLIGIIPASSRIMMGNFTIPPITSNSNSSSTSSTIGVRTALEMTTLSSSFANMFYYSKNLNRYFAYPFCLSMSVCVCVCVCVCVDSQNN